MKKTLVLVSAFFLLSACNKRYEINGTINSDINFDGEKIYLVPMEGASKETVDSTIIEGKTFRFEGDLEKEEVCIIRVRPTMRRHTQELLVIKEEGDINVEIGLNSRTHGTPQNDSLQIWKELKAKNDSLLFGLYNIKKNSQDTAVIKAANEKIEAINSYYKEIGKAMRKNNDNTFGKMLKKFGL